MLRVDSEKAVVAAVSGQLILRNPATQVERGIKRESRVSLGQEEAITLGIVILFLQFRPNGIVTFRSRGLTA